MAEGRWQSPALAHDHGVAVVELEGRGNVHRHILVALLVTVVLLDVVTACANNALVRIVQVHNACCISRRTLHSQSGMWVRHSQVVTADDDGALHLGGHDNPTQQLATDGHVSGPRALLVDVLTLLGLDRGLEPKTDVLDEAAQRLVHGQFKDACSWNGRIAPS